MSLPEGKRAYYSQPIKVFSSTRHGTMYIPNPFCATSALTSDKCSGMCDFFRIGSFVAENPPSNLELGS